MEYSLGRAEADAVKLRYDAAQESFEFRLLEMIGESDGSQNIS